MAKPVSAGAECLQHVSKKASQWDNAKAANCSVHDCDHYVEFVIKNRCTCNSASCPNKRAVSLDNRYTIREPKVGDYILESDITQLINAIKSEVSVRYNANNELNFQTKYNDTTGIDTCPLVCTADATTCSSQCTGQVVKGNIDTVICGNPNDSSDVGLIGVLPDVKPGDTILGEHYYKIKNVLNRMLKNDGFNGEDYVSTVTINQEYTKGTTITAAHINELIGIIQFIGRQCLCNTRFVCTCHGKHDDNTCVENINKSLCSTGHCNCRQVCTKCSPHCVTYGKNLTNSSAAQATTTNENHYIDMVDVIPTF